MSGFDDQLSQGSANENLSQDQSGQEKSPAEKSTGKLQTVIKAKTLSELHC